MARAKKSASKVQPPQQVEVRSVPPQALDGIPFKTVSGVAALGTPWVLQLNFTEMLVLDQNTSMQKPAAVVSMPWHLAKALHMILGDLIAGYEEQDGEIKLPKSFVQGRPKTRP